MQNSWTAQKVSRWAAEPRSRPTPGRPAAKQQDKSSWGNEEYADDIEKVANSNKEHLESAHSMAVEAREVRGPRGGALGGSAPRLTAARRR